ncbi:MAG: hypothetical protein M1817_002420 [Caeruleum heppii]|nr:MAG: hypothetical protein M1817_002420 [Caeruleum heppii]
MHFFKTVLVAASALSLASAQAILAFTSTPTSVTAGEPVTITYAGGDASAPVSIILRQGSSNDLRTVGTLTSDATGGSYTWTPDASLPSGSDYALELRQGDSNNYSGLFSLEGGLSSSPSGSSSSVSSVISSVLASASASLNSTLTNATTTMPGMVGSAASAGTGMPMSRNTTFSTPTLSTTSTETATETDASTTDAAGSSPTAAETTPRPSGSSGRIQVSSPLAFILCLVAAVMYLN